MIFFFFSRKEMPFTEKQRRLNIKRRVLGKFPLTLFKFEFIRTRIGQVIELLDDYEMISIFLKHPAHLKWYQCV